MSVVEAAERELGRVRRRDPDLADSALAASFLVLAAQLDDPHASSTSKSMCAREFRETWDRLRELMPPAETNDKLDDLHKRRQRRLAGRSAS